MAFLSTWPLADAQAGALITKFGAFKINAFDGVPPCATKSMSADLADALATALIAAFGDFKLHLYSGTQPATSTALAGSLAGYTRLITYQASVADGGGKYGMDWDTVVTGSGTAKRLSTQVCHGVAAASGTATWGVITNVDDTLGAAPTAKRLAFTVGTSGADVNVQIITFVSGSTYGFSHGDALLVRLYNSAGIAAELAAALGTPKLVYKDAGGTDGITWDSVAANSGNAARLTTQSVTGVAQATTGLTYAVITPVGDALGATTSPRLLLTVGTASSGAGVILETTSITAGDIEQLLSTFTLRPCITA